MALGLLSPLAHRLDGTLQDAALLPRHGGMRALRPGDAIKGGTEAVRDPVRHDATRQPCDSCYARDLRVRASTQVAASLGDAKRLGGVDLLHRFESCRLRNREDRVAALSRPDVAFARGER
jgi:hypothetical protein